MHLQHWLLAVFSTLAATQCAQVLPCDGFSDSKPYQQPNTTTDCYSYAITDTSTNLGAHSQPDKSTFCVADSSTKPCSDSEPDKSSNDSSDSCPDCEPHTVPNKVSNCCANATPLQF